MHRIEALIDAGESLASPSLAATRSTVGHLERFEFRRVYVDPEEGEPGSAIPRREREELSGDWEEGSWRLRQKSFTP